ncbi:DUF4190 domain-containing protein [Nocardioides sp. CFH 31398]|uniref:DUF4190 domain-containing protein n=1 Tax=Nocardioides sp. CFH 31398 TaxID=2919579 RepID=UPI001F059E72|nr:DUF4190 domain-containing protein [Nocardioides sp. CFH 31398]MCH1866091.1 DUF4190 domain-containing protein [Nocardioides sp. CFH 31398]
MSSYEMPPQSGHPHHQSYDGAKQGKGMAVTALILGVLALLLCWTVIGGVLLGLPALILGLIASSRAKKGKAGGRGLAITGWVTGLLGLVLAIALTVLAGTFLARIVDSDAAQRYEQCVSDAGGQQQQVDECERQLERDLEDTFGG